LYVKKYFYLGIFKKSGKINKTYNIITWYNPANYKTKNGKIKNK